MKLQTVSVIIPTHNNGPELPRAIESVRSQDILESDDLHIEIILVNDASDAEYLQPLNQLVRDFPECRLLHTQRQSGPAAARNRGIKESKGDIIGFLDADDVWPKDKLSLLLPYFSSSKISVVGGKIQYVFAPNAPVVPIKYEDDDQRITHVHLGGLLVRKILFDKDLLFNEQLVFSEDVDWWYRIREKEIGIILIEETTLYYHVHNNNMSINKSLDELDVLNILHQSLKRRKINTAQQKPYLPQIKDFRINRKEPLISIVIPLYNGKGLIRKTLDSVLNQTYSNWELIIIDDGSTDGGAEYISANYPQAKIIIQKNAGVAAARNVGVKESKGEFLAFLDQDDEWLPTKLEAQWNVFKTDPYCAFATCNQKFICYPDVDLPANFSEDLFKEHRSFVPSALLIRKSVLEEIDNFDESLEVSSDMDLIRRLRNQGFKEQNVDELLLKKWYHKNNASFNKSILKSEILSLLFRQSKHQ